jgi:hypothetical protein
MARGQPVLKVGKASRRLPTPKIVIKIINPAPAPVQAALAGACFN